MQSLFDVQFKFEYDRWDSDDSVRELLQPVLNDLGCKLQKVVFPAKPCLRAFVKPSALIRVITLPLLISVPADLARVQRHS